MLGNAIEDYIQTKGISQNRLAAMLEMSSTHLSDVKAGKRTPTLDKVIDICEKIELTEAEKERVIAALNIQKSSKYAELLKKKEQKQELNKLSEEASFKLANDMDLLNAFTDLYYEDDGIHKGIMIEKYGLAIINKLEYLSQRNIVSRDNDTFKVDANKYQGFTAKSSFNFLQNVIKHEENQFDVNDCLGKSRFDWDDVDDDGYTEMLKIVEEAQEKMNKIAEKHALPVNKGGKRIAYMNFMSCIQKCLIICLLSAGMINVDLVAGPGGGGHDPDTSGGGNGRLNSWSSWSRAHDAKPKHAPSKVKSFDISKRLRVFIPRNSSKSVGRTVSRFVNRLFK